METREQLRQKAIEEVDKCGSLVIPLGHPVTIALLRYLLAPSGGEGSKGGRRPHCSRCNQKVSRSWLFCAHCGNKLPHQEGSASNPENSERSN